MQETTFCQIIELEPLDSISILRISVCLNYQTASCTIRGIFNSHFVYTRENSPIISCSFDDVRSVWTTVVPSLWLMNWHHCVNWSFEAFQYQSVFFHDAPSNVSSVLFFARTNEKNRLREYSFWNTHFLNQPSYSSASSSTTSKFLFGSRLLELKACIDAQ